MKAADVFVFYDDVQFTTTRSFFARVQLKTAAGRRWLTVPVHKSGRFGQRISKTEILDDGWPACHCAAMRSAFQGAPFGATVEPLLATLTGRPWERPADLTVTTTMQMAEPLSLTPRTLRASGIGIGGSGTERLLAICRSLGATGYRTGHGALDYLEHEAFDAEGIAVEYMDYDLSLYAQLHGAFEPYVTALDVLANTGPDALAHVNAVTVPWQAMVARRAAAAGAARR